MLKTTEERVKLLKAGLTGKEIEALYIANNNIKIVRNILYNYLVTEKEGETSTRYKKLLKKDNTNLLLFIISFLTMQMLIESPLFYIF